MTQENESPSRPRILLTRHRADWFLEIFGAIALLALLLIVLFSWKLMPARVPIHYGLSGAPDAWGARELALVLPALAVLLYALLTAVAAVPHTFNYPWPITPQNAERQYRLARRMLLVLKNLIVLIFIVVFVKTWRTAVGTQTGLTPWFLPVVLLLVAGVIGWYFRAAHHRDTEDTE